MNGCAFQSTCRKNEILPQIITSMPNGHTNRPTVTNTMGAVMGERSDRREKSPKPKVKRAAKIMMGNSCMISFSSPAPRLQRKFGSRGNL